MPQYVVNAHLAENTDENWLYKLACLCDASFADGNSEHDAGEFAACLLNKLVLPSELFQSKRRVEVKCQGSKCAMSPDATYTEVEEIPRKYIQWWQTAPAAVKNPNISFKCCPKYKFRDSFEICLS